MSVSSSHLQLIEFNVLRGAEVQCHKTLKSLKAWKKALTTRCGLAEKFGESALTEPFAAHIKKAEDVVMVILWNLDEESSGESVLRLYQPHQLMICTVLPKALIEALKLLADDAQVICFVRELEELVADKGDMVDIPEAIEHEAYNPAQGGPVSRNMISSGKHWAAGPRRLCRSSIRSNL